MSKWSAGTALPGLVVEVVKRLRDEAVEELPSLQWAAEQCRTVFQVRAAGVLLADRDGGLQVAAATSPPVQALQRLATARGQGPGPACFRRGVLVLVPELPAVRGRWPQYASAARGAGICSVGSFPLHDRRAGGGLLGVLSLFDVRPGPLRSPPAAVQVVADAAALALTQRRVANQLPPREGQMDQHVSGRLLIEQAAGVLAERWQSDVTIALEALRKHARRQQMPLAEAARAILEGGPGSLPLA
ncbi:ANTAR domain-containing protein [Streptomyces sp. CA-132043]|uniref:ANTAR domain-containing protein n=1 Tax=Streptomyces sp. CA-132043 TaxID=3240048 RepID=UPI003D905C23